jgi:hypothetical protein
MWQFGNDWALQYEVRLGKMKLRSREKWSKRWREMELRNKSNHQIAY